MKFLYLLPLMAVLACDQSAPNGTFKLPKNLQVYHTTRDTVPAADQEVASTIPTINAEQYQKLLKSSQMMIDFYAPWCGPCKALVPVMNAFHARHPELPMYRVNTDEEPEIARMNDVVMVPLVKLYHHGLSAGSLQGGDDITLDNLERMLHASDI